MIKPVKILFLLFILKFNFVQGSYIFKYQTDCPFKNFLIQTNNTNNLLQNEELKTIEDLKADNEYETTDLDYYKCPGNNYESNFQLCCIDSNECCPLPEPKSFLNNFILLNKINLPYWISIFIILVFIFTFFGFFVCCFWSICPLYDSCRIRYYKDEASCAHKMGETQTNFSAMPIEETKFQNTVVITKKFDSDSLEQNSFLKKDDKALIIDGADFV